MSALTPVRTRAGTSVLVPGSMTAGVRRLKCEGSHMCLKAMRIAFGLPSAKHARQWGPVLERNGFVNVGRAKRTGDILVYNGVNSSYVGGGSGHTGIVVRTKNGDMLLSSITLKGRGTAVRLTKIGYGFVAYRRR